MYLFWALVSTIVSSALPPVLFFSLAGRWDLWYVWAHAGILTILFSFNLLALHLKSPDLLKERMKPPSGRAYWTGVICPVVQLILQPIVAGLDHRFHWSDSVALAGVVAGLVIVTIGMRVVIWAELINPFFSGAVRIQADRSQRVISQGPYAIVRHPAYAGGTLALVAGGFGVPFIGLDHPSSSDLDAHSYLSKDDRRSNAARRVGWLCRLRRESPLSLDPWHLVGAGINCHVY